MEGDNKKKTVTVFADGPDGKVPIDSGDLVKEEGGLVYYQGKHLVTGWPPSHAKISQ